MSLTSNLQPPDTHHLSSAEGWFELGNQREALAELNLVSVTEQGRVDVLGLRWSISAKLQLWDECLCIAAAIVEAAPNNEFGWIHRSYALHELGRTREARDLLSPALSRFPNNETIPYNLACYECRLGDIEAARQALARAMNLQDWKVLKAQALEDMDLQPMWAEIKEMSVSKHGAPPPLDTGLLG